MEKVHGFCRFGQAIGRCAVEYSKARSTRQKLEQTRRENSPVLALHRLIIERFSRTRKPNISKLLEIPKKLYSKSNNKKSNLVVQLCSKVI